MKKVLPILFILVVLVVAGIAVGRKNADYQHDSGLVFGTSYNITYQSNDNLKPEIEKTLAEVDASLSPFNEKSVITHVNKNEAVTLDDHFITVFRLSSEIYKDTEGAFDITVAPLVNAWGFGFKNCITPDRHAIDSLMQFVGFDKVKLQDGKIIKTDDRLMLDCSAIAKGYGVDAVARLLKSKGIDNYMVEIGGEIVASGENPKGAPWRIGVSKPDDDSVSVSNEIQGIINISNRAMATSGNYRNFYYKGGKKYAHTIDPKTGCPVQHSILSATVVSDECAKADAYATAFMVMGLDKAKAVLARHKDMMAYFIYSDDKGNNKVWYSPSLKANLEE